SLYESKPPVSRAKMAKITKLALKSVKYYKHIVQIVEKFVFKSPAEYKIPGLYVMDSIVRQSHHQYGQEKDVFAERFLRNLSRTFEHFLHCQEQEKAKIVKVLQLWQKNSTFPADTVQKLLETIEKDSSVRSTTIWLGHLNKHTTEEELRNELHKFGSIVSMNLIPPRGCSYIQFSQRGEAERALKHLRDFRLRGSKCKAAWAMGAGLKEVEKFKTHWSTEKGVSNIPWSQIDGSLNLDELAAGGVLVEESLSQSIAS
ncbi:hypothetical protein HELRODRAFT_78476, partial [Helobdella robusta]|uniref:CID domain-containing protein n=1 Tax=Helobdella robusta TaxID=6412 RepID=T1G3C3_HELRO